MSDRIEKSIELNAPPARVWKALTDHREFGTWFRVSLEGPFAPGQVARGRVTYPGYEHLLWEAVVQKMETERLFSFTWHPYSVEPGTNYSQEVPTLVEFSLEAIATGTRLKVVESGFDKLPAHRRDTAFLRNGEGWAIQMQNIAHHLGQHA
ncbi:SRPBCC family protein [Reyranella sp.]|uniref:SRPBCC family protein n=1 Tax=Reyranella sp. TaxID=1929291 RepID=UPI003BABCEE7